MRPVWKKVAALGFLLFLGLWVAGTIRGSKLPYSRPPAAPPTLGSELNSQRLQAANNLRQIGLAKAPLPLVLDQPDVGRIQVHEKTAHLTASTAAFDNDQAAIRDALAEHQAVVFNERNSGIAPDRRLTLEIGVHPEKFDALVEQLRQIGRLESFSVQQRDRTGEFRGLHARRQALKKYLETVVKLRGANNRSVEDTLKVEKQIQDIERELQALSVQFGELLGKESFYHVHLTLFEDKGGRSARAYAVARRAGHAFLWAAAWWVAVVAAAGVLVGTGLSVQVLWPKRSGGLPA
jgi:hypothetical protein